MNGTNKTDTAIVWEEDLLYYHEQIIRIGGSFFYRRTRNDKVAVPSDLKGPGWVIGAPEDVTICKPMSIEKVRIFLLQKDVSHEDVVSKMARK